MKTFEMTFQLLMQFETNFLSWKPKSSSARYRRNNMTQRKKR